MHFPAATAAAAGHLRRQGILKALLVARKLDPPGALQRRMALYVLARQALAAWGPLELAFHSSCPLQMLKTGSIGCALRSTVACSCRHGLAAAAVAVAADVAAAAAAIVAAMVPVMVWQIIGICCCS